MNNVNKNNSKNDNDKDIDNDCKDNSIENMEPLYLNAMDCRLSVIIPVEKLDLGDLSNMPRHVRLNKIFNAFVRSLEFQYKYKDYYVLEYGHMDYPRCSIYYAVLLKKDIVKNHIWPALEKGRTVVVGDAYKKKYTLAEKIRELGFCRTQDDYRNIYWMDPILLKAQYEPVKGYCEYYRDFNNNGRLFEAMWLTLRRAWGNSMLFI